MACSGPKGLNVKFVPAISSETVIAAQMAGQYDITGGNYVSYLQAQQSHHANLDIFAEGSVLQPGDIGIYTMPHSPVRTLGELKGRTVGINAPKNILYLLAHRCSPGAGCRPRARFVIAKNGLPAMPAELSGVHRQLPHNRHREGPPRRAAQDGRRRAHPERAAGRCSPIMSMDRYW